MFSQMALSGFRSPMIHHYLRKYQEDPASRIFAPLAEAYRKAGLIDEAIEIAREGLEVHPHFVGGRVALARALFDKKRFDEVITELTPVVRDVPDNLMAQKLLAESSLMLGRIADALSAYKMLLYFCPSDQETARIVWELEAQAYQEGRLVLQKDLPIPVATVRSQDLGLQHDTGVAQVDSPDRVQWMTRIEKLQNMLQKVEKYRNAAGIPR